ncbi:hypothetical protein LSAT2_012686, partial [Lamellibrachia satsuma]
MKETAFAQQLQRGQMLQQTLQWCLREQICCGPSAMRAEQRLSQWCVQLKPPLHIIRCHALSTTPTTGTPQFTTLDPTVDAYKFAFLPRTTVTWNALPDNVV